MKKLTFSPVIGLFLGATSLAHAQIPAPQVAPAPETEAKKSQPAPAAEAPGGADSSTAAQTTSAESAPPAAGDAATAQAASTTSAAPAPSAVPLAATTASAAESDAERSEEMSSLLAESNALKKQREEAVVKEPEVPPNDLPFTYHQKHIDIAAGVSLIGATNSGLDPYRENPVLAEGFLRAGGTLMTAGPWAVALLGGFGGGAYSSTVRGEESHLSVFQFNLAGEARYHFHHRFYGYGRLALGPELASSRIGSESSGLRLTEKNWAFRGEATAGVAMRLFGPSDGRERDARFWLFLEGGYRLSSSHTQSLSTDEDDGPARPVDFDLASLSTSGGLGSAGLLLTF